MKKNVFVLAAVLMMAIFSVSACSKTGAVDEGRAAPDFTIQDLGGNKVSLSDFKGKAIILNFFATWCPPCREEIPDFVNLQSKYGPKGLVTIGVSSESVSDIKSFAQTQNINYTVLVDSRESAFGSYGPIRGIPTTFIIDKDFKVRKKYIGARPGAVFEMDVKELLQ